MRSKKSNKKYFFTVIIIIICIGIFLYATQKKVVVAPVVQTVKQAETPISIIKKDFTETNFKGTRAVISGSRLIATAAQKYEDDTIAEFKTEADGDVPSMRQKFGADSPLANYEIDFDAKDIKSTTTESIVLDIYEYTGGANGSNTYKVFTESLASHTLVTLSSVIKPENQDLFVAYVKKALTKWRPEGVTDQVTFPDEIASLTFNSFINWSLDDQNLIIYFDQNSIGPGALGSVAFPIPLSSIKDFLILPTIATSSLPETYKSPTYKFTLNYPALYTVDKSYVYLALGPGKDIHGVKFTIDPAIAKGTNLGSDSYISVEEIPNASSCSASLFLDSGSATKATTITDNGTTYSMATAGDAGAGNRYEETVYALPGTNPCLAVRYYIHYAVFENYPTGTVKEFDKQALIDQFDAIRRTLVIHQ